MFLSLHFHHGVLGTFPDAFAALNAQVVVDYRIAVSILGDSPHRAQLYKGTHVVVRTNVSVYLYHDCFFLQN